MNKTTKPTFFYCYLDNETILNHLSDKQAGKLWKMLFYYANNGEKADISDTLIAMAFDVMVQQIDRDFKKYQDKCEKNKQNRAKANDCKRPSTTVNVRYQEEEKEEDKEKEEEENKEEDKEKEKYKEEEKENNIVEQDSTVYSFEILEIVEYLNEQLGTSYRSNTIATRKHIIARLKEGYTVDDFKKVIDLKIKEWLNTDMSKYLRPDTLFGAKFESYLNSPVKNDDPYRGYELLN